MMVYQYRWAMPTDSVDTPVYICDYILHCALCQDLLVKEQKLAEFIANPSIQRIAKRGTCRFTNCCSSSCAGFFTLEFFIRCSLLTVVNSLISWLCRMRGYLTRIVKIAFCWKSFTFCLKSIFLGYDFMT